MMTGYIFSTVGFATLTLGNIYVMQQTPPKGTFSSDQTLKASMIVNAVGCGLGIIGGIIIMDSYKWLGRASLKPSQYGVSFTIDLDTEEARGYGFDD